ncbi:MAG: hypothetical protein QXK84_00940 [Nitrososphaerota archaeon]
MPQVYSKKQLGAPFGDAYLAGIGVDIFKKFEDIKKFQGEVEVTMPNPVNYNIYCKYYELYKQLYSKTKEIMSSISQ